MASLFFRGFIASQIDPYLFIHPEIIFLFLVDDSIQLEKDISKIDSMIANLGKEFELTMEEDITIFLLGILIDESEYGSLFQT